MKTTTDILEEILKKVSLLEKELATNNFLLKTLLSKSNSDEIKKEKKPPTIALPLPVHVEQKKAVTEVTTQQQQIKQDPAPQVELKEEKFVVVQLVTRDKKPVFLANIEVFNDKQIKVFGGTTSSNGQWNTALPSGKYSVSVTRNASTKIEAIDVVEYFTVSLSKVKDGKITLTPIKL